MKEISPDRGENQREKSKVSPLPVSPYYTTLNCAWTPYLVCTDPMLHGPLTDSGCTYASYFTSTVTPEVKVERILEMRVEQSSDLEVGWNMEWQKCEMGHPLTVENYTQGMSSHLILYPWNHYSAPKLLLHTYIRDLVRFIIYWF